MQIKYLTAQKNYIINNSYISMSMSNRFKELRAMWDQPKEKEPELKPLPGKLNKNVSSPNQILQPKEKDVVHTQSIKKVSAVDEGEDLRFDEILRNQESDSNSGNQQNNGVDRRSVVRVNDAKKMFDYITKQSVPSQTLTSQKNKPVKFGQNKPVEVKKWQPVETIKPQPSQPLVNESHNIEKKEDTKVEKVSKVSDAKKLFQKKFEVGMIQQAPVLKKYIPSHKEQQTVKINNESNGTAHLSEKTSGNSQHQVEKSVPVKVSTMKNQLENLFKKRQDDQEQKQKNIITSSTYHLQTHSQQLLAQPTNQGHCLSLTQNIHKSIQPEPQAVEIRKIESETVSLAVRRLKQRKVKRSLEDFDDSD